MKILYDHQIFHRQKHGGITRYFVELIKGLKKIGNNEIQISIENTDNEYIKDLSELINKSIKVNQLYLKIKIKTNSITFTIKPMTSNEFEFGTLNGISTWSTKMIPISMK